MKRVEFLGCPIDISSMHESLEFIGKRVEERIFTQHVVVNVAKLVNMRKDPELDASVRECDIINIDGMGVVRGARMLGRDVPGRGPVFIADRPRKCRSSDARTDRPVAANAPGPGRTETVDGRFAAERL